MTDYGNGTGDRYQENEGVDDGRHDGERRFDGTGRHDGEGGYDGNGRQDGEGEFEDERERVRVVVHHRSGESETWATVGTNLRDHLLERGFSPYTRLTERANCGGNGLCATCGVRIEENAPDPTHWHDRLAARFGYPRLSCQVSIRGPMVVSLVEDKRVWGGRK